MEAVRRLALAGTELANATAGTIRLKLLKIVAVVTVSVRRIKLAFASACPAKALIALRLPDCSACASLQPPPRPERLRPPDDQQQGTSAGPPKPCHAQQRRRVPAVAKASADSVSPGRRSHWTPL
jgi:hypothetical protein